MPVTDLLDENAGPQLLELTPEPAPRGHVPATLPDNLTKLAAIHFAPVVAQRCDVRRDQAEVLRRIREAATLGADEFYYSFPVKTKGGGRDYIEGVSIDGAQATMQAYGNCEVDCRPVDIGPSWVFLARFIDHERGTSLIRPFIQPKGQSRLGGTDDVRRMQIDFANGVSKATRNVIANAIRPYTNYCFEAAKNDLIKRVGANLLTNKASVLKNLDTLGVPLKRVEALIGRTSNDWTAREVAALIVQIKTVRDGLAQPNDIWPAEAPPEPTRREADAPEKPAAAGETSGGPTETDPGPQ